VPLLLSLVLSFSDWNIGRLFSPEFKGIGNYVDLLKDNVFLRSIGNTFLFAFITTFLKTAIGLILALALVRKVIGNNVLRTIFYAPCVLSITVVGVLFKSILANEGLLNSGLKLLHLGMFATDWLSKYATAMSSVIFTETWMWSGFNMFIFISALQSIPVDYYEYANIEGASSWTKFWKITLPLIIPSLTVVVTLSISGGLKIFDIIYVLTNGGPGFDTQVLSTYTYQSFSLGYLGESSAGSIILSAIVVIVSFYFNRFLVKREVEM